MGITVLKLSAAQVYNYGSQWIGMVSDAACFDRARSVLYTVLVDGASGGNTLVALDINERTTKLLPDAFAAGGNNTGPFCFDASLRMVLSAGHPAGGVVGYHVDTGTTMVLHEGGLWGIPDAAAMECDGGELVIEVVDWHAERSPSLLYFFTTTATAAVLAYNHTCEVLSFMVIADPSV